MLSTEHYQLELLTPDHAPALHAYLLRNRAHLQDWEPERSEDYYSLAAVEARLIAQQAAIDGRQLFPFGAFDPSDPSDQSLLALCTYSNVVYGPFQAAHLGYSIDHERQGRGHMREILTATIDYMFSDVGLHRIMANYLPHNGRSAALLQRLGFEREGYARAYLKIAGRWQDHVLTALIRPEPDA